MTRVSISTLIPLLFISGVSGKLIQAAAGDDVKFPLTEECMKGRGTLKRRLQDNSLHSVGDLDGSWKPAPGYINRFFQSSDSVILLMFLYTRARMPSSRAAPSQQVSG